MAERRAYARIDELAWALRKPALLEARDRNGGISCGAVERTARAFRCSGRTIWRRLKREPEPRSVGFSLAPGHLIYIRLHEGNVRAAHTELKTAGVVSVHYRTFLRAFNNLPAHMQRGLRDGMSGLRSALPFLELARPTRRNEIVEIDHTLLKDITLYDPVTRRAGHPWLTVVIDVFTRVIVGFSVTLAAKDGSATSESAFLAIADALIGRVCHGERIGGRFEWIRYDQGADFMGPVAAALERLDIGLAPCEAYTPWTKPYIERFNRTLKSEILPTLAGYGVALEDAA
jgi:transposase InsO family protein